MMKWYVRLGRIMYWGIWPGSWLYLRGSRRARLLLICKDEILVVNNWLGAGKWNLPGGGLHRNEDPRQGLLREVTEETGVQLESRAVRLLAEEWYRIHGFKYRCFYFTATVEDKPAILRQPFEIIEADWVRIAEITSRTHGPDIIRALALLDSSKPL